jgi:hypothetical protein
VRKWNPEKQAYEPYIPPIGYTTLYEDDMNRLINCASCGKLIEFGEGYTSLLIHNHCGMGYSVCENCHEAELQEEMKHRGVPFTERFGDDDCDPL